MVDDDAASGRGARMPPPRGPFWKAQLIGWGLFAVVDLLNRQLMYQSLTEALTLTLVSYPLLVLLSGGLRALYRRLCPQGHLSLRTGAHVALLSLLAAAVVVTGMALVRVVLGWHVPAWRPMEEVVLPLAHYGLAFIAWGICYFWVWAEREKQRAHARAAEARMEALKAEVRALQLQLDPHFLFNTLNGLAEEVPEHPDAALGMIRDLTQYLRHLLAGIRSPVVPVAAEMEGLSAYLRIQQARFGARVRAGFDLDPQAAPRPIANLLLQPLVENAFEYGDRSKRLDVEIKVAVEGDALRIEVANTGRLAPPGAAGRHHGIGLENVRRRLDVHYPGRHTFALRQSGSGDGEADGARVVAVLRLEGEPCSAF